MKRTTPHRAAWIRSSGTKTMKEINREYLQKMLSYLRVFVLFLVKISKNS